VPVSLAYQTLSRLFAAGRGRDGVADAPCPECGPRCSSPRNGNARKLRVWPGDKPGIFTYRCARCGLRGWAAANGKATYHPPAAPPSAPPPDNTGFALNIWRRTQPASGTPVERYLHARGLTLPVPSRLRFHPSLKHPSDNRWPGMVALVTSADDRPVAVHRTWLAPGGRGKAPIEPQRMSLGPIRGGAVRLAPATDEVVVAEGIETALSVMLATGLPAWAALSAGGIRALQLPASIRAIVVATDNDDQGESKDAAQEAAQRWLHEGRRVRIATPPANCDFNDLLLRGRR
jgi:putative DNA primase/helicase